MPSSAALESDITTSAAAPSLSGQLLPAVTVPFVLKNGWQRGDGFDGDIGPRTVVGAHIAPIG